MMMSKLLGLLLVLLFPLNSLAWDSSELELFDLVEEIQKNFYEVLGLDSSATSADIRRAYRRLSLTLHPDKNKEEGAEEQFRQLVAVAEVLKDEDTRKRYDEIVEHGLPDWRQPVFYYRRVRKMGLVELAILLSIILTFGQYLVLWSMYWEKCLELEFLESKIKKPRKNKKSKKETTTDSNNVPESSPAQDDPNILRKPHLSDTLPCQLYRLCKYMIFSVPTMISWVALEIENWKESRRKLKEEAEFEEEEEEEEEEEGNDKERVKKRQRIDPALYEYDRTNSAPVSYTSSQNVTNVTDSAMSNGKTKQSSDEWTREDTNRLIKSMARYPGGSGQRWEKIANEIGWPIELVTKKAKSLKSGGFATHVDTASQGITGGVQHSVINKSGRILSDDITTLTANQAAIPHTQSANHNSAFENSKNKRKPGSSSNPAKSSERTLMIKKAQSNGSGVERTKEQEEEESLVHPGVESCAWTQRQQKVFEKALSLYPKSTDGRWDKISEAVPGKNKEECLIRFKELVEAIRRKKQSASGEQ